MGSFDGKVALVSGASRGVGFATAAGLVGRGAKVVITARGAERLESSSRALRERGGQVVAVVGDVSVRDEARRMVSAAVEKFGRLDILVNNAGVSMRGEFRDLAADVCDRVIGTNLIGSVNLAHAAIDQLVATRGHLVFISSIAGLIGLPGASVYCASKKALTGLSESLRLELIPAGVHVGVVYLGFTEHDPEKRILAADGSPSLPDRPAHHTQAQAAEMILDLVEHRRRELVMTPIGMLGGLAYRLSPELVERAILWAKTSRLGIFERFS
jgi:NAD(P)-dependent dehydrogenase (short-subunit alcohol dehydrogenase family)